MPPETITTQDTPPSHQPPTTSGSHSPKGFGSSMSNLSFPSKFSRKHLLIFAVVFAGLGSYFIFSSYAAESVVARMEAEQLTLPVGGSVITDTSASTGNAIRLNNNGTSAGNISLSRASSSLSIRAKGDQCRGNPNMVVKIDDVQISSTGVGSTAWSEYSVAKALAAGSHKIEVSFTNDYARKNCNRNLYIDKIDFLGTDTTITNPSEVAAFEAETMTFSDGRASTAYGDSSASASQALGIYWGGVQAVKDISLPKDANSFTVRAIGYVCDGNPEISLKIDGVEKMRAQTPSSSWADYTAATAITAGNHQVTVEFVNDYVNPGICDRNVSLDKISFFGTDSGPVVNTITATMKTPLNGSTISGLVPAEATASSTNGVSKVEFYIDGVLKVTEAYAPYCLAGDSGALPCNGWDSKTLANGSHSITAYAYDASGSKSPASTANFTVSNTSDPIPPTGTPITSWIPCSSTFKPRSSADAALRITRKPENRTVNATANNYVPTDAELSNFQNARDQYGRTPAQASYYAQFVDGRPGLSNPSTDDLIQWGAQKWGIPEDWLRAEYTLESGWNQHALGDRRTVGSIDYFKHPSQARIANTYDVYESLGITQLKWHPDGSSNPGTEPIRWTSTAFNIDYQAMALRFYFDDPQGLRTAWGDTSYQKCQEWNSLGGWYQPYPWNNAGQQDYIANVQGRLANRVWEQPGF